MSPVCMKVFDNGHNITYYKHDNNDSVTYEAVTVRFFSIPHYRNQW